MPCADQLWGIIARRVGNRQQLQNVEDVIETIADEFSKPSIRDWLGNAKVNVCKLDSTRAWRQHIPNLGVKLEGGFSKTMKEIICF